MKIVILDAYTVNPGDLGWDAFTPLGQLAVYEETPKEEVLARIGQAECVLVNRTPLRREIIEAAPALRYIGVMATGYNLIDIDAARERGILVCNVPGYSTNAVAQHTIALLLEISNQVGLANQEVRKAATDKNWGFWGGRMTELAGKTFGCIGFGNIGRAAGKIAAALGMRVVATGSRPTEEGKAIAEYLPLEELLHCSDVVSLHAPLLPETKGLINRDTIAQMKDGAILLNTARGGLVVEDALAEALAAGKLRAAGLDVTAVEPLQPSSPLYGAPNCYITPHIAWAPRETRARLQRVLADNLRAFMEGRPVNVVNP